MSDPVGEHLAQVQARLDDAVLPPHYPTCLGCGPDAVQGYHLQVRRDGDDVVAEHVFEPRHSGAPGIAHGGAVATVVDDVLGFLLYAGGIAGVTRHLAVDYLSPVLVGVPYVVRGRLRAHEGRKLWVDCTGTGPEGAVAFGAEGLFLQVELSHFSRASSGDGQAPIAP